jgi:hypothetical protein
VPSVRSTEWVGFGNRPGQRVDDHVMATVQERCRRQQTFDVVLLQVLEEERFEPVERDPILAVVEIDVVGVGHDHELDVLR